jgi:hypothetical protein
MEQWVTLGQTAQLATPELQGRQLPACRKYPLTQREQLAELVHCWQPTMSWPQSMHPLPARPWVGWQFVHCVWLLQLRQLGRKAPQATQMLSFKVCVLRQSTHIELLVQF